MDPVPFHPTGAIGGRYYWVTSERELVWETSDALVARLGEQGLVNYYATVEGMITRGEYVPYNSGDSENQGAIQASDVGSLTNRLPATWGYSAGLSTDPTYIED